MDFVADELAGGRRFRILTVVDQFSRMSPLLEVDFSLTGAKVVAALDRAAATYGLPRSITVDNGSEFFSKAMDTWAYTGSGQPIDLSGFRWIPSSGFSGLEVDLHTDRTRPRR